MVLFSKKSKKREESRKCPFNSLQGFPSTNERRVVQSRAASCAPNGVGPATGSGSLARSISPSPSKSKQENLLANSTDGDYHEARCHRSFLGLTPAGRRYGSGRWLWRPTLATSAGEGLSLRVRGSRCTIQGSDSGRDGTWNADDGAGLSYACNRGKSGERADVNSKKAKAEQKQEEKREETQSGARPRQVKITSWCALRTVSWLC